MAKLILIDDEDLVRYSLAKVLRKAGHEVIEAENGSHLMSTLEHESPDLIITDLIMPEQDGLGVLFDLRQAGSDIPVIAISGGGRLVDESFLDVALDMGAKAVLEKPFTNERLLAEIDRLL
ncbi:response regulator transcription factor [Imhoffiella purpurea]|uniref:Response regulator receiver protein n=1 Tax=Imhoffiella purpurea TaxID=1249627 RepID=W9W1G0_9GAMM|nr:response regulator [Imhoffiella purpurea]EXJ16430.1 response regulator receiver protein [Imhoffiella purpurea]